MAFKVVLLVAVCLAQGFAFNPLRVLPRQDALRGLPRQDGCTNPSGSFANEVEQAVQEMDALRDEVSMAAMEAYAAGKDMRIAIACFVQQSPNYVRMGAVLAKKMTEATVEVAGQLREKGVRYGKRMEGPIKALAFTFTTVPIRVYGYIETKQFLKAARLMLEARKVIRTNSLILAEAFGDMVSEVPEMAERVEYLAKDIYTTARNDAQNIREAFAKCVEQGGPKRPEEVPEKDVSEE